MKNGMFNGVPGLETLQVYLMMDSKTYKIKHVIMAYIFNGEYCGDWELNPETFEKKAWNGRDFTDVIKKWDPYTFFEEPFHECNPLIKDGSDVNLPKCELPPPPVIGPPPP